MEKSSVELVRRHEKDCGTPEAQVAYLTERIVHLTKHLQKHSHDYDTRRALMKLVGKRSRMLRYLKKKDEQKYFSVVEKLGLRK